MAKDTHDPVPPADNGAPEAAADTERNPPPPGSDASTDPRLQAAEMMYQRLASHPGATPGTRRIAGDFVSALRRVVNQARTIEGSIPSDPAQPKTRTERSTRDSLDDLDARAGDLLGALAALHSVIVRRDLTGAARALVEAERTLSEVYALQVGAQSVAEDED